MNRVLYNQVQSSPSGYLTSPSSQLRSPHEVKRQDSVFSTTSMRKPSINSPQSALSPKSDHEPRRQKRGPAMDHFVEEEPSTETTFSDEDDMHSDDTLTEDDIEYFQQHSLN